MFSFYSKLLPPIIPLYCYSVRIFKTGLFKIKRLKKKDTAVNIYGRYQVKTHKI